MIKIALDNRSEIESWFLEFGKVVLEKRLKSKKNKAICTEFIEFIKQNLDKILIGNPIDLKHLIEQFEQNKAKFSTIEINKIFNYDAFSSKDKKREWCAYNLFKKLKVNTCPYCNDTFTHTIIKSNKRILRPDLDHFYDKDTYPYLAVSLYNLIPCCTVCNSRLKLSKKFTIDSHIHPYIEGFGNDIKFNTKIKDISFFQGKPEHCDINFRFSDKESEKTKRACSNIADFKLKDMYNLHKDYVYELIHKSMIYSDDYLDDLYKQYEGTIFKNREDLVRMIASNYIDEENLNLRPLSKLTKDVVEQFGLW